MPQGQDQESGKKPCIVPVILSGGAGTRLWPLSTAARPKQFHALASDLTLFQETVLRTTGGGSVEFLAPVVIANAAHRDEVARQLAEAGKEGATIVIEPFGRNTAAAAAVAARLVAELDPCALALLLPADHVMTDPQGFREVVAGAARLAGERIVTFGIAPSRPETGYGYIQIGAPLNQGVFAVERFAEKPDLATAEGYLAGGGYVWNAGMFLFSPEVMLQELAAFRPDILEAASRALAEGARRGAEVRLSESAFQACPFESIDYAVMERTSRAAVAPCDVGWADVGSWSEIWRLRPHDPAENVLVGPSTVLEGRRNLIWSEGPPVTVIGLDNVIVVAAEDGVVVLPMSRAQEVKKAAQARTGAGARGS